jgi:hypothetical protein
MIDADTNYRQEFAKLLREIKIPAGDDEKSKLQKYSRLNCYIKSTMPKSLFRYRTLETHNIDALKKGIIPVTKPSEMRDVFDSYIFVDAEKIANKLKRIDGYFDNIADYLYKGGEIPKPALQSLSRKMQRTINANKHRLKNDPRIKATIKQLTPEVEKMLIKKAETESKTVINLLRETGYIACFCESNSNHKMWSDYADKHKGYVLECDFNTLNSRFHTLEEGGERFLPDNIVLPVVYGELYDSNEFVMFYMANEMLREVADRDVYIKQQDELWHIKGYLHKHGDYEPEAEWRLITPIHGASPSSGPFSSIAGKPKAIYYGAEMPDEVFQELDAIAKEKEIGRYRMVINHSSAAIKAILLE